MNSRATHVESLKPAHWPTKTHSDATTTAAEEMLKSRGHIVPHLWKNVPEDVIWVHVLERVLAPLRLCIHKVLFISKHIVSFPCLIVTQTRIGLWQLFKSLLRTWVLILVRMNLQWLLAVRFLDLILWRCLRYAKERVIVRLFQYVFTNLFLRVNTH